MNTHTLPLIYCWLARSFCAAVNYGTYLVLPFPCNWLFTCCQLWLYGLRCPAGHDEVWDELWFWPLSENWQMIGGEWISARLRSKIEARYSACIIRHWIDRVFFVFFLSFYLQSPVQTTVDVQQQQSQQQSLIGPQVLLQVQEDLRKLLEHRQAEEDKIRKELEGKVHALQRDSDKYRTELEHAQKEAENYRGRLEVERKENSRLHQLYEAAAKQPAASDSTEDRNSSTAKTDSNTLI